jgi:hypothetical protein
VRVRISIADAIEDAFVVADEGQEETMFLWVSSGRWELIVVSGMLSVLMQLLFWSQVVDPGNRRTHRG